MVYVHTQDMRLSYTISMNASYMFNGSQGGTDYGAEEQDEGVGAQGGIDYSRSLERQRPEDHQPGWSEQPLMNTPAWTKAQAKHKAPRPKRQVSDALQTPSRCWVVQ